MLFHHTVLALLGSTRFRSLSIVPPRRGWTACYATQTQNNDGGHGGHGTPAGQSAAFVRQKSKEENLKEPRAASGGLPSADVTLSARSEPPENRKERGTRYQVPTRNRKNLKTEET